MTYFFPSPPNKLTYSRHTSRLAHAVDYDDLDVLKNTTLFEQCHSGLFESIKKRVFNLKSLNLSKENVFHFYKPTKKTHASVAVTVVRDRKIRTALRTNGIAGFVTYLFDLPGILPV